MEGCIHRPLLTRSRFIPLLSSGEEQQQNDRLHLNADIYVEDTINVCFPRGPPKPKSMVKVWDLEVRLTNNGLSIAERRAIHEHKCRAMAYGLSRRRRDAFGLLHDRSVRLLRLVFYIGATRMA